jgi:carboxypeptidase C (cathepsin A)
MTDIKIRDSKGNIYDSCPFINKIIQFLDTQIESANAIKIELENVRAINSELRKESLGGDYKDKLKIVEDYLGVDFEGNSAKYSAKYFELGIKEIANKISTLEKENQELKEEINNLTNKN